jgi:hypothetical protein
VEHFSPCIAPRSLLKIAQKSANFARKWPFLPPKTPFLAYWAPFFALFSRFFARGGATPFLGSGRGEGGPRGVGGGRAEPPLRGGRRRPGGCKKFLINFFPTQLRWGTRTHSVTKFLPTPFNCFPPENRHGARCKKYLFFPSQGQHAKRTRVACPFACGPPPHHLKDV